MTDEPHVLRPRRVQVVTGFISSPPLDWPWKPNWIAYRASLRAIDRRQEHDPDDIAKTCLVCGCETDITPQPHSPRCTTLREPNA